MSFDAAMDFVARWEGGFVDHPRDPGGATNLGVTQRVYDRHRRDQGKPVRSVREIAELEADQIYNQRYWLTAKCDHLPGPLAVIVFDCAVNQGPGIARRLLQVSAGAKADGKIGPLTLARVQLQWVGNPAALIVELCARRALRYAGTRNRDVFGLGWFRRLCDCERAALDLMTAGKTDG